MILTTTDNVEGYEIEEYLGLVAGSHLCSVGTTYVDGTCTQDRLYKAALINAENNLKTDAEALDADAVIGIRQNMTSPGEIAGMVLSLTGTAVKLRGYAEKKKQQGVKERRLPEHI